MTDQTTASSTAPPNPPLGPAGTGTVNTAGETFTRVARYVGFPPCDADPDADTVIVDSQGRRVGGVYRAGGEIGHPPPYDGRWRSWGVAGPGDHDTREEAEDYQIAVAVERPVDAVAVVEVYQDPHGWSPANDDEMLNRRVRSTSVADVDEQARFLADLYHHYRRVPVRVALSAGGTTVTAYAPPINGGDPTGADTDYKPTDCPGLTERTSVADPDAPITYLNPYLTGQAHADGCGGLPLFEDVYGQWSARCGDYVRIQPEGADRTRLVPCPWEVTGCESRAEAGAAFYGAKPTDPVSRPVLMLVQRPVGSGGFDLVIEGGAALATVRASSRRDERLVIQCDLPGAVPTRSIDVSEEGGKWSVHARREARTVAVDIIRGWLRRAGLTAGEVDVRVVIPDDGE